MSNNYRLTAATGLHKGDRQHQQNQVAIFQHSRNKHCLLGIVADGMGGRSGGRKAAVQVLLSARQLFEHFGPDSENPKTFPQNIVKESHLVIRLTAVSSEQEPHSTLAAFVVMPQGQCHWVHAGDSRLYHFQLGRLTFQTKDHSYVQALIDSSEISEDKARGHPSSTVLLGCLGSDVDPTASFYSINKRDVGDVVMACSDGLWSHFSSTELGQTTQMLGARDAVMFLVGKARERARGAGDNLSVAVIMLQAFPFAQTPTESFEQCNGVSIGVTI